jgi:hypothetical protein
MLLQIFVVPALFVIFQYLQEKIKPLEFNDEENREVKSELKQYARQMAIEKDMKSKQ